MKSLALALVAMFALAVPVQASHQAPPPSRPHVAKDVRAAIKVSARLAARMQARLHARSFFVGHCNRPAPGVIRCRVDFYGVPNAHEGCLFRSTVTRRNARLAPVDCWLG
jgi:hypothetical protein